MNITQTKELYAPPVCEALEMKLEGVIAASGDADSSASWGTETWPPTS